ncbi:phosphoethanolamine transferase [Helicobacter cetorum]|uniref:phosphoethanolamine transferase n=1 Tax=Helicobacter cetorum TaxID=138563 RepID=UPI000CF10316|nr:phosphoethanolamine transferase [Helicobacter cetorum]
MGGGGVSPTKSQAYIFNRVISPAAHTSASFKVLLTYANNDTQKSSTKKPWYAYANLGSIINTAGYESFWFSNQEKGWEEHSNSFGILSSVFKHRHFIKADYINTYDEALLPLLEKSKLKDKNFIVFHLSGSHILYNVRFPKSFEKFKPKDIDFSYLKTRTNADKQVVADYINSLYYTDSILNRIVSFFKDKESLVIYISDHAQDVYESWDKALHHCNAYGVEIPFIIYASPLYAKHHQDKIQVIQNALNKPFMSDNFLHTLLELIGIRTKDYDPTKDLLSPSFNSKRILNPCKSFIYHNRHAS